MKHAKGDNKVLWLDDVEEHDYHSAFEYLSLRFEPSLAESYVKALKKTNIVIRRVNDVLRACQLEPLPYGDPGTQKDLKKIASGEKLSPVLVISLEEWADVADGYHRLSAVYHNDPFDMVPLKIAGYGYRVVK